MNRILLLEDDVSLIDGLQYSLKKNGFEVEIVRTVHEAFTALQDIGKYDLLLLDVTLPDGTGFEVCEKVRKQNHQIPIIYLTASDEEVSVIRGLDCGGDDYITKPFKLGELCSRIRALLRRAGILGDTENLERIPAKIRKAKNLPLLFETAVELGRRRAVVEPGIVVPQGYQGKIQYLLPVYLTNMKKPDLVMTLEVMDGYYMGHTCLTLEMAYLNARVVARPLVPWLTELVK